VSIVIKDMDEILELHGARGGLTPHWWKKDTPLSMMLNAKQDLPHASMHL